MTKRTHTEKPKRRPAFKKRVGVVDLFCGAGGLSHGFYRQGFNVLAGVDVDEKCRHPFEVNNDSSFLAKDVSRLTTTDLEGYFGDASTTVLVGCAPCQPFSTYNQKNEDPKWEMVGAFGRLINEFRPDVVSMENVPRLKKFRGGAIFETFVDTLQEAGFHVVHTELYGPDYGMAQQRRRLVLLASRLGPIDLPKPTHSEEDHRALKAAIGHLTPLVAGEVDASDALHRASGMSDLNLKRMNASKPGGNWHDWPVELRTPCHVAKTGKGYVSVYGRMQWEAPSPTITTQFFGFGNGRFGHPEQNRALSLREGAILQGFPADYSFVPEDTKIHFKTLGRMIGNAVPVEIAEAIARTVKKHLKKHEK